MAEHKILLITYYWPPAGGPGVQRWYKLTKYLIKLGYAVDVITVDPDMANYPVRDHTLIEKWEESDQLKVIRTNNFDIFNIFQKFSKKSEYPISGFANSSNTKLSLTSKLIRVIRSRYFLPDPRKFWNKYAIRAANKQLNTSTYSAVITTSPPHSSQLIGLNLKKQHPSIKWIADFRDPWTDIYYYDSFLHSKRSAKKDLKMEKQVIKNCDQMLVVGNNMKRLFEEKYNTILDNKIHEIPNGYDPEDIKSTSIPASTSFNIVYTGTLAENYPLDSFIDSIQQIKNDYSSIKVTFVGRVDDHSKQRLNDSLNETVEFIGFVSHQKAIDYMHKANLLLLIIPDHEHNKIHLSGKIFEYMAAKRPILTIGPKDGDAAIVIAETKSGNSYEYDDNVGILHYIQALISHQKEKPEFLKQNNSPEQYSRKFIASNLIKIIENE